MSPRGTSRLASMALRSVLRRAGVGRSRPSGTQVMQRSRSSCPHVAQTRSVLPLSLASSPSPSSVLLKEEYQEKSSTLFSSPSTSDAELEPPINVGSSGVQVSLSAFRDSPSLSTHCFQSHGNILDPRALGEISVNQGIHLLAFSVISGSLPALVFGNAYRNGCIGGSQVRTIYSSGWKSSPRQVERPRYSGRPIDRDHSGRDAERQARFDENFKRLPVLKKPLTEYRQSIVDNSMKNMPLVPKKWKRALPSKEVIDAVIYLKRAKKNRDAVKEVIRKRVARMLKLEMMLVLSELQRLDEPFLAHQVFNAVRKESWYKPNVYLYQTMVQTFGKSKQTNSAVSMLNELQSEGLQPDQSIKRELLRAYVISGMMAEAIKVYKEIQNAGPLDAAARSILFHGLNDEQKLELAAYEKAQGYDWS